jgi:hypothetical protein
MHDESCHYVSDCVFDCRLISVTVNLVELTLALSGSIIQGQMYLLATTVMNDVVMQ